MWIGFAVSFILLSVNGLHSYFPNFPQITKAFTLPLFRDTVGLSFWFSPPWTGFFYFVNLDITASIWIFYILTTVQRGIFNIVGVQSTQRIDFYSIEPFLAHQGMGLDDRLCASGIVGGTRPFTKCLPQSLPWRRRGRRQRRDAILPTGPFRPAMWHLP